MKSSRLVFALTLSFVTACAAEDAEVDGPSTCTSERFAMTGALDVQTRSVSIYRISGAVIGIAGLTTASSSFSFTVRDFVADQLGAIGIYDAADTNIRYLEAAATANCMMPGQCNGFIATSGTFEVVSDQPYRATFSLGDLHAYDGSSTTLGAAMSGTVAGCFEAAPE
jgi:hypothetical protein